MNMKEESEKNIDCVKMKNEIQEKLYERWKNMSDDEIEQDIKERIDNIESPIANLGKKPHKQAS